MAAQLLVDGGHQVVLHARNESRAEDALATDVARQANALGTFDAVIHNAAVGNCEPHRIETRDVVRPD